MMYAKIKTHPTTRTLYAEQLMREGIISEADSLRLVDDYRDLLDAGTHVVKSLVREPNKALFIDWAPYLGHSLEDDWDTGFKLKRLQELGNRLDTIPEGMVLQRQVKKIIEDRQKMTAGALPINRSEEHTSELQSRPHLVCRLLLEKKKLLNVLL